MSEKDFVDLLNEEMKELVENLPQVKQLKQELEELKEDNKRLNELLVGGTEVIDYWNNKYLEERAKNAELQEQVDELTIENENAQKALHNYLQPRKEIEMQAVKDIAPLAIQRFINQLYIDRIITDSDLENEMLKVKSFVLKRYYGVEVE